MHQIDHAYILRIASMPWVDCCSFPVFVPSVDHGSEINPAVFEEQDLISDEQGKHNLLSAHI